MRRSSDGRAGKTVRLALRGLADNEPRLKQDPLRRNRFAGFDELERQRAGLPADGHGLLVHAGKRNFEEFVVEQVAAAHHRNVFGNIKARFEQQIGRASCRERV